MLKHCYQNIPGWFDFQSVYEEAVRDASDGDILVEVGAWLGKSTAFMAVEIINSGKRLVFDVIDTWEGNVGEPNTTAPIKNGGTLRALFDANMKDRGLSGHCNPITSDSVAAASKYADGSVRFCYIDADHRYETVLADLTAWWPKVAPSGTLAGHDLRFSTVRRAVQEFCATAGVEFETRDNSWIFRKPS